MDQEFTDSALKAFYLDRLNLPPARDINELEVEAQIREYIRVALPLFEPVIF